MPIPIKQLDAARKAAQTALYDGWAAAVFYCRGSDEVGIESVGRVAGAAIASRWPVDRFLIAAAGGHPITDPTGLCDVSTYHEGAFVLANQVKGCIERADRRGVEVFAVLTPLQLKAYSSRIDREYATAAGAAAPAKGTAIKKGPVEPMPYMIQAYRLHTLRGGKQAEVADWMSKELGKPVEQAVVSRWLKRVRKWIEAGNVLPDIPTSNSRPNGRAIPMDPGIIDAGQRTDGRTPRQRDRWDDD